MPAQNFNHPVLFVCGNPTAGKSTLAKKLEARGVRRVSVDAIRYGLRHDPHYGPAANFYAHQPSEERYYGRNDPDACWANLVEQSEALWPAIFHQIECGYRIKPGPTVFEGVNLLPRLVARDFPGQPIVAIVSTDKATIRARLEEDPRWGREPKLWDLEAAEFADQATRYRALAELEGGVAFGSSDDAVGHCLKLLGVDP